MTSDQGREVDEPEAVDESDWVLAAWLDLSERSRQVLLRRLAGETLQQVGDSITPAVTRERTRQIESDANSALRTSQLRAAPRVREGLEAAQNTHLVFSTSEARAIIGTSSHHACMALLVALGYKVARSWTQKLDGYWSDQPTQLRKRLTDFAARAPLTHPEAADTARDIGLPHNPPWDSLLDEEDSRVIRHDLGWIRRRSSVTRDLAYLWLKSEGEPRPNVEIAEIAGCTGQIARETMRRDPDFAQVRPEGTWALSDWRTPGADHRYSSAVDAVVDVVRDFGPLGMEQLHVEVQKRYPVSNWRIQQCLSSNMIGHYADGTIDLTERGAIPIEDTEPKQPSYMKTSGDVIGVTLPVNHDLMRGSGISVNRWLTWRLGLRTAPSTRHFDLPGGLGTVRVTRATSNYQISSLRLVALHLGLVEGCNLALILNLRTNLATVNHVCKVGQCAAARGLIAITSMWPPNSVT